MSVCVVTESLRTKLTAGRCSTRPRLLKYSQGKLMITMTKQPRTLLLLLAGCLTAGIAGASTIAFDNAAAISPVQGFGGELGLDFTVNSAITIDQLGAFDNGIVAKFAGADGHSGVTIQIYNITSTPVAIGPSVTFTPTNAGTQINGDAFLSVSPFTLGVGRYTVVAVNDDNYNTLGTANTTSTENTDGGLITFSGSSRYSVSTSSFPAQPDGGPGTVDAGTFSFGAAAAPEPSTFVLFGLGGALAFFARRRRA